MFVRLTLFSSSFHFSYIQQLREGVHNFFVTFIEVLRDRPPGHDWELEPGVTCGDYLFGMLQVNMRKISFEYSLRCGDIPATCFSFINEAN